MATPFSFQSLNFNNIPGREIEANRRYTAGLEGMFKSIGEGAKDIASTYMSEEERKKREAEDKKKWDNMIAQQEYQKEQNELSRSYQEQRDLINDTRYDNEYGIKQNERMMKEGALKNIKAQYGTMDTSNMTPEEQELINSVQFAPTYADAIAAQNSLNQYRYQQQMLKAQKEQNERAARQEEQAKIAENMLNEVAARENASTFNYNVNAELPPKELLPAYRDEIQENLDYLLSDKTPSLSKNAKIKEYKTLLAAINKKQAYKTKMSETDAALSKYRNE